MNVCVIRSRPSTLNNRSSRIVRQLIIGSVIPIRVTMFAYPRGRRSGFTASVISSESKGGRKQTANLYLKAQNLRNTTDSNIGNFYTRGFTRIIMRFNRTRVSISKNSRTNAQTRCTSTAKMAVSGGANGSEREI